MCCSEPCPTCARLVGHCQKTSIHSFGCRKPPTCINSGWYALGLSVASSLALHNLYRSLILNEGSGGEGDRSHLRPVNLGLILWVDDGIPTTSQLGPQCSSLSKQRRLASCSRGALITKSLLWIQCPRRAWLQYLSMVGSKQSQSCFSSVKGSNLRFYHRVVLIRYKSYCLIHHLSSKLCLP